MPHRLVSRHWTSACQALTCHHVTSNTTPTEVIRPTLRTKIFLSKTPHLFCRCTRTFPYSMRCLLTTEQVSATAHIGIDRFVDPCEFGANGVDTDPSIWHDSD
jgi:hypothetical protein